MNIFSRKVDANQGLSEEDDYLEFNICHLCTK